VELDNGIVLLKVSAASQQHMAHSSSGRAARALALPSSRHTEQKARGSSWQHSAVLCAVQGLVSSEDAAAMLSDPQLEASDLVPNKYEGRGGGAQIRHMFVLMMLMLQAHLCQLTSSFGCSE
jgi:hypothetical protein